MAARSWSGWRGTERRERVLLPGAVAVALATARGRLRFASPRHELFSRAAGCPAGIAGVAGALPARSAQPAPQLDENKVNTALGTLDGLVQDAMRRTGVPGVSVAVVYQGEVVYLKGFGVRRVGKPGQVDADTVFQLASVSKPLATTVLAKLVGDKTISWDDPVTKHDPGFALADPWVTEHMTLMDLLSHRSGLPQYVGDDLEALGYDRGYILSHLRDQTLLPFRDTYGYTNFGFTAAADAAARAKHMPWEDLAAGELHSRLGMTSTSSRFSDYEKAANQAATHVRGPGRVWQAKYVQNADPEAPAGGVSSTARDMAQWLRLQLGDGQLHGKRIVDAEALATTHVPLVMRRLPDAPAGRTSFYGLGWDVSYDDEGRLVLDHGGAATTGAATDVGMLPSEQLGIVVLTNGEPRGVPESIVHTFLDTAQHGSPTVDWWPYIESRFKQALETAGPNYAKPPASPAPAADARTYVGSYANSYFGPLTVAAAGDKLVMRLGRRTFELKHYDGTTFSFPYYASTVAAVTFSPGQGGTGQGGPGQGGKAASAKIEALDSAGFGTFVRG